MRIAFDIIGDSSKAVAIIELPKAAKGASGIASDIMRRHGNVKSVLAKVGPRAGEYRTYQLQLIAGSKRTEVTHQEYGLKFKLDPAKVFFSPREGEERQRIAKMVKPGERVLVMFAGAGPYAFAIAKAQPKCKVEAIELNRTAVHYALENVKLNGLGLRVKIHHGDAAHSAQLGKFDRIVMPLPEKALKFLPAAFAASNKDAMIHLYSIESEKGLFHELDKKVMMAVHGTKMKYRIVDRRKVLPYAPRTWKVRMDIKVL